MESRRSVACFFHFWLVRYAHMTSAQRNQLIATVGRRAMTHAGDRLGVAVSGGADSVALLLLFLELRDKLGIVLSVVHFNHKLRGRASDADEKFVARLAAKLGLAFHSGSLDVAGKAKKERANLEDTARRARYSYFQSLVESGELTRVAVAHTADDQAETVLAHLLRGTGLTGLGGIHPAAGAVIRPLLGVRRSELRVFLQARKQTWREDATNRDTKRMRARIRKKLLPLLQKQFQPAIVEHLATLAGLAREDEAFLDGLAEERTASLVQKKDEQARIFVDDLFQPWKKTEFNKENTEYTERTRALSKRMVRRIVESVKLREGQLGAGHVEAVLELARSGRSGSSLALPGGVEVRKGREALVFHAVEKAGGRTSQSTPREYEYKIDLARGNAEVQVAELGCVFRLRVIDWPRKRGETSRDGFVLDRDRLHFPMVLRNWRPGDRLRPQGHRSAHKLKRLLNEKRVSRWERDGWPVLMSNGVLVWARGFPVAAEFAANEGARAGIVIVEEKI
jgi:tRNA(Ile)-lysidine synthase